MNLYDCLRKNNRIKLAFFVAAPLFFFSLVSALSLLPEQLFKYELTCSHSLCPFSSFANRSRPSLLTSVDSASAVVSYVCFHSPQYKNCKWLSLQYAPFIVCRLAARSHKHTYLKMGGLFRSQEMTYVRLLMTREAAPGIVRALGKAGFFHFVDLSNDESPSEAYLQNKQRVVNCVFWERKLNSFRDLMKEANVAAPPVDTEPREMRVSDVLEDVQQFVENAMNELDQHLKSKGIYESSIHEQQELGHVLKICQDSSIFRRDRQKGGISRGGFGEDGEGEALTRPLIMEGGEAKVKGGGEAKVNCLTGAVSYAQQSLFERMVFRMTRGNVITTFQEIEELVIDAETGQPTKKSVFQLIFYGEPMRRRIENVCKFFKAKLYDVPADAAGVEAKLVEIMQQTQEFQKVLDETEDAIHKILSDLAWSSRGESGSPLVDWEWAVRQERMICECLKKCDTSRSQMIQAQGWIPESEKNELQVILRDAAASKEERPAVEFLEWKKNVKPPTYFKTNKFTEVFQLIVDTYGVPRYQEANPGLFTIITFPFLYGVMYGDIGHGTCQLIGSIWICLNEASFAARGRRKELGEIEGMIYGGRYMLLFMSFFGLYCGTIYNDCFSIMTNAFGSSWVFKEGNPYPYWLGTVYPWGVDPGWAHTANMLAFMNSLKMKMAVILGVIQMTFGVILGLTNDIYFRDYVKVVFEFIPRFVFLTFTFGYMCVIIIFKMCIDWQVTFNGVTWGTRNDISPPNLVQTMIQFFLSPGKVEPEVQLYEGQDRIQFALLICALIAVPVMLLGEPIIQHCSHKHGGHDEHHHEEVAPLTEMKGTETPTGAKKDEPEEEEHGFGDLLIHQMIHTIEYVLGTVSNTASYLRLWALSLAHSQLAEVFWSKCLMDYGILTLKPIMAVAGFIAWFFATVGVLIIMDALECFLHALRLHWVEFQNKFFAADGYAFRPFDFKKDHQDL
eukprot:g32929.t1